MSILTSATASRSARTPTGTSVEEMSIEDIDALMVVRQKKIAEKQAPLEDVLNAEYAKCVELANEIKAFNPAYKSPWEATTPLMLGHAIKDWLSANDGSATTTAIMEQFGHLNTVKQIEDVLKGRTKGDKYRLWDYNKSNDTYTLKDNKSKN
jgi:hypothetical protein